MDLRTAKLRVIAKKFKASIPAGMALRIPDEILDKLADKDIQDFYRILNELGLQRQQGGGYWERLT